MSNDGQNVDNTQDDDSMQNNQPARGGSDEASNNPGTAQNGGSAEKDPKDWVTGDEDATPAQKSYLSTMAVEVHEAVPENLTKAEASEKIEELQEKTGRQDSTYKP
ncbi:MAG TPA: DUF3072 domain-containing protein [Candidatus Limnocylindrales bacterium]|nr:DUF3072 domain-containing protein [Candidatus Limnocylindrales bacterium]